MKVKVIVTAIMVTMALVILTMADNNHSPQSFTVGLTSTLVIPSVHPLSAENWAITNAYSVGDYVQVYTNNMRRYFWCVGAGTSNTGAPAWSTSADTADDSVTWRYIDQKRTALYIGNDNDGALYLGWGTAAVTNKGMRLNANGGSRLMEDMKAWQGEVYAISPAAVTNTVLTQDLAQ